MNKQIFCVIAIAIAIVTTPNVYAADYFDDSGNGWTLYNDVGTPTLRTQGNNSYLYFDGNDGLRSYVQMPKLDGTTNFTFTANIRFNTTSSGAAPFIAKNYNFTANRGTQVRVSGTAPSTDNITVGTGNIFVNANQTATNDVWRNIQVVYRTTPVLEIWVDGVLSANSTTTVKNEDTSDIYTYIGRQDTSYFVGGLDDIRFFNKTLNSSEISQVASNTTGVATSNLVAWYKFDTEQVDTITINYSVNGEEVNDYFYGVNVGYAWGSNASMVVDANGDGSLDATSNSSWHRTNYNAGGFNFLRLTTNMDLVAYQNSTFKETGDNKANAQNVRNMVRWAAENTAAGKPTKILLTYNGMPSWLAINNTALCNAGNSLCTFSNASRYYDLIQDHLEYVTDNHTNDEYVAVETWNEPTLTSFFLPNLHQTNNITQRMQYFNELHQVTYNATKAYNSSIQVAGGGFAIYTYWNPYSQQWLNSYCTNNTAYGDAVSYHVYPEITDGSMSSNMAAFQANVTAFCPSNMQVWLTEWNYDNANSQVNESNTTFAAQVFDGYQYMLNTNASRYASPGFYTWQEYTPYSPIIDGYPKRWPIVFEANGANFTPTYYVPYYITQRLSNYHESGAAINTYTSSDSNIKIIASTKDGNRYFTIANLGAAASNSLNITITGTSGEDITNLDNSSIYSASGSVYSIGILPAYTIQTYQVTSTANIAINSTSPANPVSIVEPNNQTFSFTLNNTDTQEVTVAWSFNGTNQTGCANLTSCTFTSNYTSAGNYNISFTATAATNSVNYSWSFTVNNTPVNISFQTTTPSSPVTISVGSATNFVYVLTNLDSQITNSTWVLDGVTVAGCANSTVCSWTPTSGQTGLHELNVTVTAATNTLYYTWDVTVEAAQTNQCGVTGLTGFFNYIPVVFVIFSLVGLITVIIGGSDDLVMTLSLAGLGMVLTVLVIVLGCL